MPWKKNRRVKVSGTHRDYDLDVSEPEHTISRERNRRHRADQRASQGGRRRREAEGGGPPSRGGGARTSPLNRCYCATDPACGYQ